MLHFSTYEKLYSIDEKQHIAKSRTPISQIDPILKGSTIESVFSNDQIILTKIQESESIGHGRIPGRFIVFVGVFNSIE